MAAPLPIDTMSDMRGNFEPGSSASTVEAHWVHHGQALLKLDRSFSTGNNLVTAFGPELVFEPTRYVRSLRWWNEIGIRLTYLNSFNQPARATPYDNGRGYDVQVWLDIAGWRPRVGFWRGVNFLSQQGDPEFVAGNFMEVGLSKVFVLGDEASIEFGVQARHLRNAVNEVIPQGTKWVNQQYLVFNWNWDTADGRFMRDLFPAQSTPASPEQAAEATPRFTAKTRYVDLCRITSPIQASSKSEDDRSRTVPSPANISLPCSDTALRPG